MPNPIDLSTERAIRDATARALDLRADMRDGRYLDDEDVRWLADIACAALLLCQPFDVDLAAWLAGADEFLDETARPGWLAALCE